MAAWGRIPCTSSTARAGSGRRGWSTSWRPCSTIAMKKPLTIHHLYTHTSGLTVGWPGWADDLHDVPERIAAYADRGRRIGEAEHGEATAR